MRESVISWQLLWGSNDSSPWERQLLAKPISPSYIRYLRWFFKQLIICMCRLVGAFELIKQTLRGQAAPLRLIQQWPVEGGIFLSSLLVSAHLLKCSVVGRKASDRLKLHFRRICSRMKTSYPFSLYIHTEIIFSNMLFLFFCFPVCLHFA